MRSIGEIREAYDDFLIEKDGTMICEDKNNFDICAEDTLEHYEKIAKKLEQYGTVVFSYSPDKKSCAIILLSIAHKQLNHLAFGGQSGSGYILVGVRLRGFNIFEIESCRNGLHRDYIEEKLGTSTDLSKLLKEVSKRILK